MQRKIESEPSSAENEPRTKEQVVEFILQKFYDPVDHEKVKKTLNNYIKLVDNEGVTFLVTVPDEGKVGFTLPWNGVLDAFNQALRDRQSSASRILSINAKHHDGYQAKTIDNSDKLSPGGWRHITTLLLQYRPEQRVSGTQASSGKDLTYYDDRRDLWPDKKSKRK